MEKICMYMYMYVYIYIYYMYIYIHVYICINIYTYSYTTYVCTIYIVARYDKFFLMTIINMIIIVIICVQIYIYIIHISLVSGVNPPKTYQSTWIIIPGWKTNMLSITLYVSGICARKK